MTEDDLLVCRQKLRTKEKPQKGWRRAAVEERKDVLRLRIQNQTTEYLANGGQIQFCTWRDNQGVDERICVSKKDSIKRQKRLANNSRLIALDKKAVAI